MPRVYRIENLPYFFDSCLLLNSTPVHMVSKRNSPQITFIAHIPDFSQLVRNMSLVVLQLLFHLLLKLVQIRLQFRPASTLKCAARAQTSLAQKISPDVGLYARSFISQHGFADACSVIVCISTGAQHTGG